MKQISGNKLLVRALKEEGLAVDTGTVNGKYWIFALGMKVMLGAFFFEKGGI